MRTIERRPGMEQPINRTVPVKEIIEGHSPSAIVVVSVQQKRLFRSIILYKCNNNVGVGGIDKNSTSVFLKKYYGITTYLLLE